MTKILAEGKFTQIFCWVGFWIEEPIKSMRDLVHSGGTI